MGINSSESAHKQESRRIMAVIISVVKNSTAGSAPEAGSFSRAARYVPMHSGLRDREDSSPVGFRIDDAHKSPNMSPLRGLDDHE